MAYEHTTLLFDGPSADVVAKRHAAGVCASFVFDWLKKCLAAKPVNASTYGLLKQIKKLVTRQMKYEKNGAYDYLAGLYELDIKESIADRIFRDGNRVWSNSGRLGATIEALPAGYYYISIGDFGGGHGIGYNKHTGQFCDVNVGIMSLDDRSMESVLFEAVKLYAEHLDSTVQCQFFTVALTPAGQVKADKAAAKNK